MYFTRVSAFLKCGAYERMLAQLAGKWGDMGKYVSMNKPHEVNSDEMVSHDLEMLWSSDLHPASTARAALSLTALMSQSAGLVFVRPCRILFLGGSDHCFSVDGASSDLSKLYSPAR